MAFLYSKQVYLKQERELLPADGLQREVPMCIEVIKDRKTQPVGECELVARQVDSHITWVDAEGDLQNKVRSQRKLLPRYSQPFPVPLHCCASPCSAR